MPTGTVFKNNRTQAVRLPSETRFGDHVKKVNVRIMGVDRIISPVNQTWNTFFTNTPAASEDFMAERATQTQTERESF